MQATARRDSRARAHRIATSVRDSLAQIPKPGASVVRGQSAASPRRTASPSLPTSTSPLCHVVSPSLLCPATKERHWQATSDQVAAHYLARSSPPALIAVGCKKLTWEVRSARIRRIRGGEVGADSSRDLNLPRVGGHPAKGSRSQGVHDCGQEMEEQIRRQFFDERSLVGSPRRRCPMVCASRAITTWPTEPRDGRSSLGWLRRPTSKSSHTDPTSAKGWIPRLTSGTQGRREGGSLGAQPARARWAARGSGRGSRAAGFTDSALQGRWRRS